MGSVRSRRPSSLLSTEVANLHDTKKLPECAERAERVRFAHGLSLLSSAMRGKFSLDDLDRPLDQSSIVGARRATL